MKEVFGEIRTQLLILATLVGIMWGLEILDTFVFQHGLDTLGILPRNSIGLRGILFAPFLHGSFAHLTANTLPFLALGWLIMAQSIKNFVIVSLICMLVGGSGTWLFGASALHIGASGVIFGYLGFLLARYYFDRRLSSGIIALFVGCTYGSVLWGILPSLPGISWEGHLFGFLSGILAAKFAIDS
ncbi:rhomboid family intramembrane serine protease [Chamaesiphon sp. VAR_48_metabat_135_sub]|uniref:rhomboid family intramembrane serine protease n=1 Tax=Chamaesiphon sp. VAR_48_metabat_135_sub TaxID=2964699 RepID=UPI00286D42EE|nr:rhomboid family intramembrane serine protease [Chamaesiphon sp. VAR_48_metabat_135_sub]